MVTGSTVVSVQMANPTGVVPEKTGKSINDITALHASKGWEHLKSRASRHGLHRSPFARKALDWLSIILILLNSFYLGIESEVRMRSAISNEASPRWLWSVNVAFSIAFVVELLVKVLILQDRFFRDDWCWNLFDFLLVLSSIGDVVFEALNISYLRTLRVIRAVRAARVIRTIGYVRELRLMVASIASSLPSLAWAFVLLFLLLFLYALLIMQGVEDHLQQHGMNERLIQLYGSLLTSVMSLFMAISGGVDWGEVLEPLKRVGPYYLPLFVLFITFVVFGVLNILTAIFIEASSGIIEIDRDLVVQQNISEESSTMNQLKRLFREIDTENTGRIHKDQIDEVFSTRATIALLKTFGLDISQARGFFRLLDMDMTNEVDIEEFVCGLMRLRGWAKGVDVATIMYENKRLFGRLKEFMKEVDGNFKMLAPKVDALAQMAPLLHQVAGRRTGELRGSELPSPLRL